MECAMKKASRAFLIYTGILYLFLAAGALSFAEEDIPYTNESFARLTFISGKAFIQRAADSGFEEGEINMPISEGDRLGTTDGRAEIYLYRGKYIRLDHNTKVDFLKLPDKTNTITQLRIWSGNVYIHVQRVEEEKNIEVHTTDVSLYILDRGIYRIDVRENMETEVFVFYGLLEAALDSGSFLIKDEQRIEAIDGESTSRPSGFDAATRDSFDWWNHDRDMALNLNPAKRYLPDELEDFEVELEEHGDWDYVEPYGNVWIPGGIGSGWRPFTNGRWIWLSVPGWTWLPYEPWGWAPFHFGRWQWGPELGWYWIPTRNWGPAWVSWYWGSDYWAWTPMSYYGYPGVILNNRYYPRHTGYYPLSSPAVTVIRRNQRQERNISRISLQSSEIGSLGRISLSSTRPADRPIRSTSIQGLDRQRMILGNRSSSEIRSNPPEKMRPPSKDKAIRKKSGREGTGERKIRKNPVYPSSPAFRSSRTTRSGEPESSKKGVGQIYDYISRLKTGSGFTNRSAGKSVNTRSRTKTAPSSSKRAASSRSSKAKKSSVKKKKK
jgi:hypothetical protein